MDNTFYIITQNLRALQSPIRETYENDENNLQNQQEGFQLRCAIKLLTSNNVGMMVITLMG